tara:strand:+ start:1247 stop:1546 length:300 start_codon:yes stop_codon:yes gene_type:complete
MSNNLFVITGQEEEDTTTPFGWDDMPQFKNEDNEAWKVMKIRFRNEEDMKEFAEIINQRNITTKTKSIWHPAINKKENSLVRYIEEKDLDKYDIEEIIE